LEIASSSSGLLAMTLSLKHQTRIFAGL